MLRRKNIPVKRQADVVDLTDDAVTERPMKGIRTDVQLAACSALVSSPVNTTKPAAGASAPPTPLFRGSALTPKEHDPALASAEAFSVLLRRENEFRVFDPRSRYAKYRQSLVAWVLFEASRTLRFSSVTAHVTVAYMDRVLPGLSLDRERYRLMSAACLLIAGKYEEEEANLPAPDAFRQYLGGSYTAETLAQAEIMLLERLHWSCTAITPLSFLGHFYSQSVAFHDDTMNGLPLPSKTPRKIREFCEFFMDLTVQDYSFARYSPSLIAAAVLVASRRALNIVPVWNAALQPILSYDHDKLVPCLEHIWSSYAAAYPEAAAQCSPKRATAVAELDSPSGVSEL